MSDDILTICVGDQSACEGDDNGSPSPEAQEATPQGQTLNGSSQHAANADSTWMAATSAPDFCRVGNRIIGFESTATLESPVRYSPDVIAAGCELYRVGDLFQGIQGDAGQHVVSGTSLGSGHVLITGGQDNVKVNGLPMARHDSPCMINCNGAGVGGTPGYLVTRPQAVESTPGQSGEGGPGYNAGEEGLRVINDKWEGAKSAAKTFWEALPITGDEATTGAARDRMVQGAKDTYEAVDVLTGPSPLDLIDSGIGWLQGDAERAGQFGEEWKRTGEAYGSIKDSMVNAWQEAEERNGTFGAMEMSVVVLLGELVGGKGTGVLRGATKIPDLETPPPPRAPDGDGTHISCNATNHQKGAFGEARAHGVMTRNGMEPIGRTDGVYQPGQTGIDGLYRNPSPPPDFVVTEAKFGSGRLGRLADGTKQMDNDWVRRRLFEATDGRRNPALYREVEKAQRAGRIDKYLIRVKSDGSSRVRLLDDNARIIGDAPGF
ncbi:hypothetical protein [Vreelandella titanicae]|uniref:hypothetical protein n=1 Tax=Vreelandella titanicae TaxID=664683 RepID=UPI0039BEF27C